MTKYMISIKVQNLSNKLYELFNIVIVINKNWK